MGDRSGSHLAKVQICKRTRSYTPKNKEKGTANGIGLGHGESFFGSGHSYPHRSMETDIAKKRESPANNVSKLRSNAVKLQPVPARSSSSEGESDLNGGPLAVQT